MTQQHVLVVDDDPKYHAMLSDAFADLKVSTAKNGREALDNLAHIKPDLIILDIVMPEMDGYEACKAIRSFKPTASTPIIFFSGMESLENKLKAYDLGGNDYITKSNSSQEIRAKVKRLLTSEQERRAIQKDLEAGNSLLENMQKETSALHLLSQFSQASQFCFDHETLATVLFNCLFKLNLRGVICFRDEGKVYSSNGSCSRLEEELLRDADSFQRIHAFSENRVIFNWETCALLVKDVGDDDLDTMAHFMGAVQTAIRSLEMHIRMVEKVLTLEVKYRELKGRLTDQSTETSNLKEQLFDSGLVSRFDFDIEAEKELDDILKPYGNDLVDIFVDADESVEEVNKLLSLIHTPPPELEDLFVKRNAIYIHPEEVDDVLF